MLDAASAPRDGLTVPNARLLFQGDYHRDGFDLVIADGEDRLVVHDYFRPGRRPDLKSPDGAGLTGDVVEALTQADHAQRYAQAGAVPAPQAIGRVETVAGSATAIRNGVSVVLSVGDLVYKGDTVQTGGGSSLAIAFIDGTTFNLSASARMVLNEMVYQPGSTGNTSLLSLVQGSISFVAGQVAKTGDMRVDTPVATMGIRGTAVIVEISADNGATKFSVVREPDGTVGSYVLLSKVTGQVIATVSQNDVGYLISAPAATPVAFGKGPAEIAVDSTLIQRVDQIRIDAARNPIPTGPTTPATPETPADPNAPNGPGRTGDPAPARAAGGAGSSSDSSTASLNRPVGTNDTPLTASSALVVAVVNKLTTDASAPVRPATSTTADTVQSRPSGGGGGSGSGNGNVTDVTSTPSTPSPTSEPTALNPFTVALAADQAVVVDRLDGVLSRGPGTGLTDAELQALKTLQASEHVVSAASVTLGTAGVAMPTGGGPAVVTGRYGVLRISDDGSYSYAALTPQTALAAKALPEGVDARDVFTFSETGEAGDEQRGTLTFVVSGRNDAPDARDDHHAATVLQGGIATASTRGNGVLANDSDPDTGETATLQVAALVGAAAGSPGSAKGLYGTLAVSPDGTYTYTADNAARLAAGVVGEDSFQYLAADSHDAADLATLTFTVEGLNDAPVVARALQGRSIGEDSAWRYMVPAATFTDVDEDPLTYGATLEGGGALPSWLSFDASSRTFSGTPPRDFNGALRLTVSASDGTLSAATTFTLTVTPVNDAPVATGLTGRLTIAQDGAAAFLFATAPIVTDVDSPRVTATLTLSDPSAGTLAGAGPGSGGIYTVFGTPADVGAALAGITFLPAAGYTGSSTVAVSVTDGQAGPQGTNPTGTVSLTVGSAGNHPPTAPGPVDAGATDEDSGPVAAIDLLAGATDSDGDPLAIRPDDLGRPDVLVSVVAGSWDPSQIAFAVDSQGRLTFDPGQFNALRFDETVQLAFAYAIVDGQGGVLAQSATITVVGRNDSPIPANDLRQGVVAGMTASAETRDAGILANDSDPDFGETALLQVATIRTVGAATGRDLTPIAAGYLTHNHDLVPVDPNGGFGTNVLPPNDDGSSGAIDITGIFGSAGINFFGRAFTTLYINNNGNVTFTAPSSTFVPTPINGSAANPIIAPFWYDIDTRPGPLTPSAGGTSTGADIVTWELDTANGVFTATWDDVGYFSNGTDRPNAFQLQLVDHGSGDFDIVFRYESTTYGGSTGARAGYSAGTAETSFELAGSGDATAVTGLADRIGNTGLAGVYVFEVRNGQVASPAIPLNGGQADITGLYGTLHLSANGTYAYAADNAARLAAGEMAVDHFAYTASDGRAASPALLDFEVVGVNDAPILAADDSGPHQIQERADTTGSTTPNPLPPLSGSLLFTDPDAGDVHAVGIVAARLLDATGNDVGRQFGLTTETLASVLGLSVRDLSGGGAVDWTFSVPDSALDPIPAGVTLHLVYTVAVTDAAGLASSTDLAFEITGANDAPVVTSAPATGTVDQNTARSASGRIVASDADLGSVLTYTAAQGEQPGSAVHRGANPFLLDEFRITRNGGAFYDDPFDDNAPALSGTFFANGNPATYSTTATFAETGGRLVPTSSTGSTGAGSPSAFISSNALLESYIAPADPTRGLRSDDDFSVEARFDLSTLPADPRTGFGIRLTDVTAGGAGQPANAGENVVELTVRRGVDGIVRADLRQVSFVGAGSSVVLQNMVLQPQAGDDQIVLRLAHSVAASANDPGAVLASFDYAAGGTVSDSRAFAAHGHIFGHAPGATVAEDWTRTQIVSYAPARSDTLVQGTYGRLDLSQAGEWFYTVDAANAEVRALGAGNAVHDVFDVMIGDGTTATPQTIDVTVQGVNDPPVAQDDRLVLATEGVSFQVTAAALLFNDSDPDNPASDLVVPLNTVGFDRPNGASIDGADDVINISVPSRSSIGPLHYQAADGSAVSAQAHVTITDVEGQVSIAGGGGGDILVPLETGGQLTGGAGRDVFVLTGGPQGRLAPYLITDFADGTSGDVVDLTFVIGGEVTPDGAGGSQPIGDYVRLAVRADEVGNGSHLEIDLDFDGAGAAAGPQALASLANLDAAIDHDVMLIWHQHRTLLHYDHAVASE